MYEYNEFYMFIWILINIQTELCKAVTSKKITEYPSF